MVSPCIKLSISLALNIQQLVTKDYLFSKELNLSSEKLGCKYMIQLTGTISISSFIIASFLLTISLTKNRYYYKSLLFLY